MLIILTVENCVHPQRPPGPFPAIVAVTDPRNFSSLWTHTLSVVVAENCESAHHPEHALNPWSGPVCGCTPFPTPFQSDVSKKHRPQSAAGFTTRLRERPTKPNRHNLWKTRILRPFSAFGTKKSRFSLVFRGFLLALSLLVGYSPSGSEFSGVSFAFI